MSCRNCAGNESGNDSNNGIVSFEEDMISGNPWNGLQRMMPEGIKR